MKSCGHTTDLQNANEPSALWNRGFGAGLWPLPGTVHNDLRAEMGISAHPCAAFGDLLTWWQSNAFTMDFLSHAPASEHYYSLCN